MGFHLLSRTITLITVCCASMLFRMMISSQCPVEDDSEHLLLQSHSELKREQAARQEVLVSSSSSTRQELWAPCYYPEYTLIADLRAGDNGCAREGNVMTKKAVHVRSVKKCKQRCSGAPYFSFHPSSGYCTCRRSCKLLAPSSTYRTPALIYQMCPHAVEMQTTAPSTTTEPSSTEESDTGLGFFQFQLSDGKCVYPEGGDSSPIGNTNLVLQDRCDNTPPALFKMLHRGDGFFNLLHYGGQCIHPKNGYNWPPDGNELVLWRGCDLTRPKQLFSLVESEGFYVLQHASGKCVHHQNPPDFGEAQNIVRSGAKLVFREGCVPMDKQNPALAFRLLPHVHGDTTIMSRNDDVTTYGQIVGEGDAVIDFGGKTMFGTPEAAFMLRPSWSKTLRCRDALPESCEECADVDGVNCWGAALYGAYGYGRAISWDGIASWERFVNEIHVQCNSQEIIAYACFEVLRFSTVSFSWDGVDIEQQQGDYTMMEIPATDFANTFKPTSSVCQPTSINDRMIVMHLSLGDNEGGHVFTMQMEPNANNAEVVITFLRFTMPALFAFCEDSKVCLGTLDEYGQQGLELRNSNALQLQCLKAQEPQSSECAAWRSCLTQTVLDDGDTHLHRLMLLLHASGVDERSPQTSLAEDSGTSFNDTHCLFPPNEDMESWDCDCYDNAISLCMQVRDEPGWSEETCLRATICMHTKVCQHWKDAFCTGNSTNGHQLMSLVKALSQASSVSMTSIARHHISTSANDEYDTADSYNSTASGAMMDRAVVQPLKVFSASQSDAFDGITSAKECN